MFGWLLKLGNGHGNAFSFPFREFYFAIVSQQTNIVTGNVIAFPFPNFRKPTKQPLEERC